MFKLTILKPTINHSHHFVNFPNRQHLRNKVLNDLKHSINHRKSKVNATFVMPTVGLNEYKRGSFSLNRCGSSSPEKQCRNYAYNHYCYYREEPPLHPERRRRSLFYRRRGFFRNLFYWDPRIHERISVLTPFFDHVGGVAYAVSVCVYACVVTPVIACCAIIPSSTCRELRACLLVIINEVVMVKFSVLSIKCRKNELNVRFW